VVGRLGPIFQGVTARLLDAGAIVVAPSLDKTALDELQDNLCNPAGLLTVQGTLAHKDGAKHLTDIVKYEVGKLHGVVAHGGLDGVYHNENTSIVGRNFLKTPTKDILDELTHLVGTHHHAACILMPLLNQLAEATPALPSFTLLTGGLPCVVPDSSDQQTGAEGPVLTSMYGFGLALRRAAWNSKVRVNEIRLGMHVNRCDSERMADPRVRPLSLDLGTLCSYIAESPVDRDRRIRINNNADLDQVLVSYDAFPNHFFKIDPPARQDPGRFPKGHPGKSNHRWLFHPQPVGWTKQNK